MSSKYLSLAISLKKDITCLPQVKILILYFILQLGDKIFIKLIKRRQNSTSFMVNFLTRCKIIKIIMQEAKVWISNCLQKKNNF